jgi:hypothetical protein
MKIVVACILALVAFAPAVLAQDGCEVRSKNEAVLQQGENYLHGQSTFGEYNDYFGWLSVPECGWPATKPTQHRDIDYLTGQISDAAEIEAASQQANQLEQNGQSWLAKVIRLRIEWAAKEIYGKPLGENQLLCISTARKLHESAWKLELHSAYPLAEKSYRGEIEIYRKELGNDIPTANALGDLARVLIAEGKGTEAMALYKEATQIYTANPTRMDADSASVLEAYADRLSQQNPALSNNIYAKARIARNNAYRRKNFGS